MGAGCFPAGRWGAGADRSRRRAGSSFFSSLTWRDEQKASSERDGDGKTDNLPAERHLENILSLLLTDVVLPLTLIRSRDERRKVEIGGDEGRGRRKRGEQTAVTYHCIYHWNENLMEM